MAGGSIGDVTAGVTRGEVEDVVAATDRGVGELGACTLLVTRVSQRYHISAAKSIHS